MNGKVGKAKLVLACLVWLVLLTIGALLYKWLIVPAKQEQQAAAEQELIEATSGNSTYRYHLRLGLDAFSGYAVLRSDQFRQQLRGQGIKLDCIDDGADYRGRLQSLADGKLQLAAFPIDALIKSSAAHGGLPATIIALIDETRGADAVVAYRQRFPNIDALNAPDTRFVLVGDSPSETLVRLLMRSFQLPALSPQAIVRVNSEDEVLQRYRRAAPADPEVFVTWEPVVSHLLENDQMHVLFDSSQQSGIIVDALVVSRDFLVKNEPVVRQVLESYFRALYALREPSAMQRLVAEDARAGGVELQPQQVQRLVDGIWWKNTQENYAHFGLRSSSLPYIEDMIDRIERLLEQTGGLDRDPTGGVASRLFYEKPLAQMHESGFHPGLRPEQIREDAPLPELTAEQWERLVPVGTVDVPPLVYARGTARLTEASRRKLDELVETLKSFPTFYLMIRGHASNRGDPEMNRRLAQQRAEAARDYLLEKGVPAARMRALPGEITGQTTVTFVLGQPPY
ncbi:MAG: hypothetical protein D6753_11900 [Planctomycetota bacterium]|nr:MAG: hypothetical protein D6753_11900 [Planctomycetota bacterium]